MEDVIIPAPCNSLSLPSQILVDGLSSLLQLLSTSCLELDRNSVLLTNSSFEQVPPLAHDTCCVDEPSLYGSCDKRVEDKRGAADDGGLLRGVACAHVGHTLTAQKVRFLVSLASPLSRLALYKKKI